MNIKGIKKFIFGPIHLFSVWPLYMNVGSITGHDTEISVNFLGKFIIKTLKKICYHILQ